MTSETRHKYDPAKFADRYWRQWCSYSWHKVVNDNWTACCVRCGRNFVLCEGLFFRGATEMQNLVCDGCWYAGSQSGEPCDLCGSTKTKTYPAVGNRILCTDHKPRPGYLVPLLPPPKLRAKLSKGER